MLECSGKEQAGGNSRFTAGAMRVAYRGVKDLMELMPDLTQAEFDNTDLGSYPADQFLNDLRRITEYPKDADLAYTLVSKSFSTLKWMRDKGVRFVTCNRRHVLGLPALRWRPPFFRNRRLRKHS